jgi:hypothetical protein
VHYVWATVAYGRAVVVGVAAAMLDEERLEDALGGRTALLVCVLEVGIA